MERNSLEYDQGHERDRRRTRDRRWASDRRWTTNRRWTRDRRWTRVECHRRTGVILTHSGEGEKAQCVWQHNLDGLKNAQLTETSTLLSIPPSHFPLVQDLPSSSKPSCIAKQIHTRCCLRDSHVGRRDWRQGAGSSRGTARVGLEVLHFTWNEPREPNQKNLDKLKKCFEKG